MKVMGDLIRIGVLHEASDDTAFALSRLACDSEVASCWQQRADILANRCKFLPTPNEALQTTLYKTTMVNNQRLEALFTLDSLLLFCLQDSRGS